LRMELDECPGLMVMLLRRACCDPGVETFLQQVFTFLGGHTKGCRLVCKEWAHFIREKVWKGPNRKRLLKALDVRWTTGAFLESKLEVARLPGVKVSRMMCDDFTLVAIMDTNRISLYNLVNKRHIKDITAFEMSEDFIISDLEVEMSASYLVAGHTSRVGYEQESPVIDVDLTIWDKMSGRNVSRRKFKFQEMFWSFKVQISDTFILLMRKSTLSILAVERTPNPSGSSRSYSTGYSLSIEDLHSNREVPGIVTVLKIADPVFFTGDMEGNIKVWSLAEGTKIKTITTGSPLQDVCLASRNILVTVGGINGAEGVSFWSLNSGQKLVSHCVSDIEEEGKFNDVVVRGNRVLADGYNQAIIFEIDFANLSHYKQMFKETNKVVAMNRTCFVSVNFSDFQGSIDVRDYWS